MRVICIDAEAWPIGFPVLDNHGIIETGKTYNVVDVFFDDGYIWFVIENDIGFGYWENAFARTSDVEEVQTKFIKRELVK